MVGIWAGGVAHTPLTLNTARTTLDSSCCSFQESCGQFNSKKLVCWLVFLPLTKVLLAMDQESMVSGVLSSPYPQIWEPELGLNLPTWLRANIQTTNLIVSPILFGFRFSELLHTLLCDWQLATCNGKREQSVMEHRGGGGRNTLLRALIKELQFIHTAEERKIYAWRSFSSVLSKLPRANRRSMRDEKRGCITLQIHSAGLSFTWAKEGGLGEGGRERALFCH